MRFFGSLTKSSTKERNALKMLVMSDEVSVVVPRARYLKVSSYAELLMLVSVVNHVKVRLRLFVSKLMSG